MAAGVTTSKPTRTRCLAAKLPTAPTALMIGQVYGVAPEVRVTGDVGAVLPYIPSHLDYMMYEVGGLSCVRLYCVSQYL